MSSNLPYRHISYAVDKATAYINKRRKGEERSLKTGTHKLDGATLDGFEWNRIVTLAGLPGSGKSITLEQLKYGLLENNDEPIDILSFEFEMLSTDQVVRKLSSKLSKSVKELYSADGGFMSEEEFEAVANIGASLSKYPIYYVDYSGTVAQIVSTIMDFAKKKQLKENDTGLIVTIDHVLLTKGSTTDSEKKIIDNLCKSMIEVKKWFDANDMKILIIMVSQMNRNIRSPERILKPKLHYPDETDLFGASSIMQASDLVIMCHKPSLIEGITEYGPRNLPVFNPSKEEQPMIYWHMIKNRLGKPAILMMLDDFANSRVQEYYRETNRNE